MVTSLQKLGHKVPYADANAPVEIYFSQPTWFDWTNPDAYHIAFTPWESSELPEGWLEPLNEADEVWTPSPLIAQWYKEAGVVKPIYVYEHGINDMWTPKKRNKNSRIKFLFIGDPAVRKNGQIAFEAFREAFGDRDDVRLTIKSYGESIIRVYQGRGARRSIIGLPHQMYSNVSMITENIPEDQLVALYHFNDCVVYPSSGEGFGLIPFQALATGMPTICTEAWAPYKRFLGPLALDSKLGDSPWPDMHPGKMFWPDFDDLVNKYKKTAEEFESLSDFYYNQAEQLHKEYDWLTLTENAFDHIVKMFG